MADFLPNFIRQSGIADPRNYRFLEEAASNVLSRVVPKNVNWGGLPTGYLDTLDKIKRMAPGSAKEAARTSAKTTLTRAAVQPPNRPPINAAGPGGMLRAPAVGAPAQPGTILSRGPVTQIPGSPVQFNPALRRQFGWTGGAQQVANKLLPASGAGFLRGAGRLAGPIGIGTDIYYTGKQVFNPEDNIITRVQALGTGIGNLLQGRDYLDSTKNRPVVNPEFLRPDYSGAGERARRFQEYRTGRDIPGANTDYSARLNGLNASSVPAALVPGSAVAAPIDPYAAQNRAYQQERARIEAMVKANPDMQKQEIADARAKVRDQGMAIWAAKYGGQGGLAERVKPGQVGYDAIQRGLYDQGVLPVPTLEQMPEGVPTQGPTPNIPQIDPTLNPAGPNYLGGEGPPLMNFADPRFENMSPEEFQKLLNQVNRK